MEGGDEERFLRPETERSAAGWLTGRLARLGVAKAGGPSNESLVWIWPFELRRWLCKFVCCGKHGVSYVFNADGSLCFHARKTGAASTAWVVDS